MELVAIVTLFMLIQYNVFGYLVGRARSRTGIKAPAVSGNAEFERYFRAHQNEMEQLVWVVPAMWLAGFFVHAPAAAGLGLAYLLGRALYFSAYVKDAAKRGPGFIIGWLSGIALVLGGLAGALMSLME